MVVNEVTSSVQGKGTKTIVAAAVATMIAGVSGTAMAADPVAADAIIGAEQAITVTTKTDEAGTQIYQVTGDVKKAEEKNEKWVAQTGENSSFKADANTLTDKTVALNGGALNLLATEKGIVALQVKDILGYGTISLKSYGNSTADKTVDGKTATLTVTENVKLDSGTIAFSTANLAQKPGADAEKTTLAVTKDLILGVASAPAQGEAGKTVAMTVDANTNAVITAKNATLTNVAIDNAGSLSITVSAPAEGPAADDGALVLGKDSTISNSGKLALAGKTVAFNADYTEGEKGTLFLTGTDSVAIAGAVKGSNIAFSSGTVKDATITINGGTTGTTITGSVEATGTMTLGTDAKVTNKGDLTAAKTEVNASDVTLTNALIKTVNVNGVNQNFYGSVSLGELTVTKDGALSVSNADPKKAVTATKLTVQKDSTNEQTVGAFTVATGAFETAGLDNEGTITLTIDKSKFTLTGEGKNAGSIAFDNAASTFKVGSESVLSNVYGATVGSATETTNGKLVIDGAVNNLGKIGVHDIEVNGLLDNQTAKPTSGEQKGEIRAATVKITKDGVLNAGATYDVGATNVYGTFNALELNATVGESEKANALTIIHGITLNEGAKLNAAGAAVQNVVLGKTENSTGTAGTLTIASGSFDFDTVENKYTGSAFTVKDGSATVKELTTIADTKVTVGAVTAATGALTVTDKLTSVPGSVDVYGDLNVSLKSLGYKVADDKVVKLSETSTVTVADKSVNLFQNGVLTLTDYAQAEATVKLDNFDRITAILADNPKGLVDLGNVTTADLNAKLSAGKISKTDFDALKLGGLTTTALKSATVTGVVGATGFANTQNLGKVELSVDAPTDNSVVNLAINAHTTLTLNNDGAIVTYKDGKTTGVAFADATSELVTTGTSEVGELKGEADKGIVTVKSNALTVKGDVVLKTLNVREGAVLNIEQLADATKAHTVEVAGSTIDGAFNAAQNTVTAKATTINGSAVIGVLAKDSAVQVGSDKHAATLSLGELAKDANVTVGITDEEWKKGGDVISRAAVKTNLSTASLHVNNGSIVSVGTSDLTIADAALTKTGFTVAPTFPAEGEDSVDSFETRTVNSFVAVYGNASGKVLPVTGHIDGLGAANSMLYVDGNTIDKTGVIGVFAKQDITFQPNSVVYFDNVVNGDVIKIANEGTINNVKPATFFEGDILMDVTRKDGKITFSMVDRDDIAREIGDIVGFDAAYGMFEEGKNLGNDSASAKFNKWLYTSLTTPVLFKNSEGEYELEATKLKKITSEVGALGATSGVQTVTLDAVNMMADTAAARTSILNQKAEGAQVWADVNGGSFEAKKLFNGAGYSSDIWAGSIGVDYTAACGGTLGATLTIGTADTDSKNTGVVSSTDSDLVGFTVYASQTFNDVLGVALDLGYLKASNDVTANGYEQAWNYSQDTDAFTFGVRGEVLTKVGSVNIVPHAGLRWTRITTDDFEAGYTTDVSTMNVFQLPLGVTVSGEFEAASWTLAPKFDLSVVPAFGDKDAELKLGIAGVSATDDLAVRVVDSNPVQATLGLSATNGAWAFGLNYKLGVATDSRMNNTFNANVRYAF